MYHTYIDIFTDVCYLVLYVNADKPTIFVYGNTLFSQIFILPDHVDTCLPVLNK